MAKGLAIATALLLAGCSQAAADGLPDWKKEKFTVIEKDEAGAVAISAPHQDSKDVRSVWVLIYYAEVSEKGTQAIVGKVEFNCTFSQAKYNTGYRLAPDTTVLGELHPSQEGFQPVQLHSPTAGLFERVCGHPANNSVEAQI
jgi:hypothetical protein